MDIVEQGRTYPFDFEMSGEGALSFAVGYSVLQYPGATPDITGSMTVSGGKYIGELTAAQTAALAVGQWFIHINPVDADENLAKRIKIYIAKGWA